MRERGKLPVMIRLAMVQRVRRAAAEAALGQANAAEAKARLAEEEARQGSRTAERQWRDHIREPGFSPEYGRVLSGRLIDREMEADGASARATNAAELRERRQADWQTQEARVRLNEASVRRLRRKAERRLAENRLTDMADRVTYVWSRP